MSAHPAVGIDLGTTYSAVAHLDVDGRPWTITNAEGDTTTPSAVFFDPAGAVVGREALAAGFYEPEHLARFAKRDMGEETYAREIRGVRLPPEVLQALVLAKLQADAELRLGPFSKAVVTVPAFFNEPCRKATQDAGRLAGLDVIDIINEPTAAAICYGIQKGFLDLDGSSEGPERILVYDLGGGTFDVTLMAIEGLNYTTLATAGDVYLGGVDWDHRLADHLAEVFQSEHGVDPRQEVAGEQLLLQRAGDAKHALTARDHAVVFLDYQGHRSKVEVTRQTFDGLTEDLLDRTLTTTRKVLRDGGCDFSDLTRLLLVGGSTRMPQVRSMLEQESGLALDRSLSPDEAVAHGAAIYAGLLLRTGQQRIDGISVTNVNSHDLGVLGVEPGTGRPRRSVMIRRNTPLPAAVRKKFPTLSEGQTTVKVDVVEGGDDAGNNATRIGRCAVRNLPAGLAAGTPIEVTFRYGTDGRLTVEARLPDTEARTRLHIERASGMNEAEFQRWAELVRSGFSEGAFAALAHPAPDASQATVPQADEAPATAPEAQPEESETQAAPQAVETQPASKAAATAVSGAEQTESRAQDARAEPEQPRPGRDEPAPPTRAPDERSPVPQQESGVDAEAEPQDEPPKRDWRSRARKLSSDG